MCYLVAGQGLAWAEPGARLVLPGGDHRACPRTCASVAALQAAEVLEWARGQGAPALQAVLCEGGLLWGVFGVVSYECCRLLSKKMVSQLCRLQVPRYSSRRAASAAALQPILHPSPVTVLWEMPFGMSWWNFTAMQPRDAL